MAKFTLEVEQGAVIINTITASYFGEDVVVFNIDCRTKYTDLGTTYSDSRHPNRRSFTFAANDNSLRTDEASDDETIVHINCPSDNMDWQFSINETARYEYRLIMWRVVDKSYGWLFETLYEREGRFE